MDVREMRHVLAVAQHGSFARAAQALNIAQPSLSKSIARLEDQLKVRLFDRTAQGSTPTAIGELIVERAARVVAEARGMVRDAQLAAGGEGGELRLGIGSSLRGAFSMALLNQLVQTHPRLRLFIDYEERGRLVPKLATRELDVVLCAADEDLLGPELVIEEIVRTEAIVAASPAHPLAAARDIPVARLAHYPAAGPQIPNFSVAALLGVGPDEVVERYTATDWEPLIALAEMGKAILVAPYIALRPNLRAGTLVRLDHKLDFHLSFVAACTRPASYSPVVSRLVRHAQAVGQQFTSDWRG